jgi:hypothetical protein
MKEEFNLFMNSSKIELLDMLKDVNRLERPI